MVDSLPDPHGFLDTIDWARLEHGGGSAFPATPVKLAALLQDDAAEAAVGVDHLWDDLFHQGSLYSATVPAALYVAAVVSQPTGKDYFTLGSENMGRPLRSQLLDWLAEVAYSVSDAMEKKGQAWFGRSMAERSPLFGELRAIRPALFQGVLPWANDSNKDIREAALLAALHLLDAPELISQRVVMAPLVSGVLAVSSKHSYRAAAEAGLAAWGEGAESLGVSMGPAETEEEEWNRFWTADRGPIDEAPF